MKLGLKSLQYRKLEFGLFTLYKITNGKYKVFLVNFSIINISLQEIIIKENVNIILKTVSGKVHFFTEQKLYGTGYHWMWYRVRGWSIFVKN